MQSDMLLNTFELPEQFWIQLGTGPIETTSLQPGDHIDFDNRTDGCHIRFIRPCGEIDLTLAFGQTADNREEELYFRHACDFAVFLEQLTNELDHISFVSILREMKNERDTGHLSASFEIKRQPSSGSRQTYNN